MKVNSKKKGSRVERELAKLLTDRFGREFSRSVGSGNRWSQVADMPDAARETFAGDLVVPTGFRWSLECKGGYDSSDTLASLLSSGSKQIDEWLAQAQADSERSGRKPLICWKPSRRPWLAIVRRSDFQESGFDRILMYSRDWFVVSLEDLLATSDSMFF
jgi:Holliday junction resolvase